MTIEQGTCDACGIGLSDHYACFQRISERRNANPPHTKQTTRAFYPGVNPGVPTVSITLMRTYTECLKCGVRFLTEIRRMTPDGYEFRSQPRCPDCR